MKRFFILCLSLISGAAICATAQQRDCNLSVELVSPTEGAVINSMAEFDVIVELTNNGSDTLLAGDTIYYHTPLMFVFDYMPLVLTHGIAPGAMRVVNLEEIVNANENTADEQLDFCVTVRHNLDDAGSFTDDDLADNSSCNNITLKATFPVSTTELVTASRLSLYPNPAQGYLNVELPETLDPSAAIVIIDLAGKVVHRQQLNGSVAGQTISVQLQQLPAGTYILQLNSGNQQSAALFSCL